MNKTPQVIFSLKMAFVSVPKDLSKVKTKVALNLTKRQLVCFGTAAVVGIPLYIFTRKAIGNSAAALLMIAAMLPFFFIGIYEKDGMPAERILMNFVRSRFAWPGKRPYKTENFYELLECKGVAAQLKDTAKQTAGKQPRRNDSAKRKP